MAGFSFNASAKMNIPAQEATPGIELLTLENKSLNVEVLRAFFSAPVTGNFKFGSDETKEPLPAPGPQNFEFESDEAKESLSELSLAIASVIKTAPSLDETVSSISLVQPNITTTDSSATLTPESVNYDNQEQMEEIQTDKLEVPKPLKATRTNITTKNSKQNKTQQRKTYKTRQTAVNPIKIVKPLKVDEMKIPKPTAVSIFKRYVEETKINNEASVSKPNSGKTVNKLQRPIQNQGSNHIRQLNKSCVSTMSAKRPTKFSRMLRLLYILQNMTSSVETNYQGVKKLRAQVKHSMKSAEAMQRTTNPNGDRYSETTRPFLFLLDVITGYENDLTRFYQKLLDMKISIQSEANLKKIPQNEYYFQRSFQNIENGLASLATRLVQLDKRVAAQTSHYSRLCKLILDNKKPTVHPGLLKAQKYL